MKEIIYVVDDNENKNYKYNIEKDTIIYHFAINSSSEVELNLVKEDVSVYYYYNNINYDDNRFSIKVNHLKSKTHSEVFNHGVNVFCNKLMYYVDGIVPKNSSKCICNQDNQIINMDNGKSTICPNLLIDNYDVDSNHGAYIGKFKDEIMFYMMSRGISREVAYRLLLQGFLINSDSVEKDKIKLFLDEIEKNLGGGIMHREDFAMLNNDIVFFDNGATTLKPKCVVERMVEYYTKYTSNIHRGDYDAAIKTNELYDDTRDVVAKFVNANSDEVIFTSGTTMSINMVVFGYMEKYLKAGDEVLLTRSEHASNVLPWIKLSEKIGIVLKYMDLDEEYALTVDSVLKSITNKTKVISIAHVTNVIGDVRDIGTIGKICKEKSILFCVDGAQSVPHMKVDFKNSNIDFLSFSGHKMCGPTGVGCLVANEKYLAKMEPLCYGGGMNQFFESDGRYELKKGITKFEAGTPPIAEVIGLREAILYLMDIGMDNIHKHEMNLKKYLVSELKKIKNIKMYNEKSDSGILAFNIDGVFAQDSSVYLNHYNIYVRAGNHCTKMLKDEIGVKNTVRVSLYFYNTKEDIDKLVNVLKQSDDIFKIVI